jgi:hypothetical protein
MGDKDVPMVGAFPAVMTGPSNVDALQRHYVCMGIRHSSSLISEGEIREHKMYASRISGKDRGKHPCRGMDGRKKERRSLVVPIIWGDCFE